MKPASLPRARAKQPPDAVSRRREPAPRVAMRQAATASCRACTDEVEACGARFECNPPGGRTTPPPHAIESPTDGHQASRHGSPRSPAWTFGIAPTRPGAALSTTGRRRALATEAGSCSDNTLEAL